MSQAKSAEKVVQDIRRKTRRPHLSPRELAALERLWAGKSDESLEEAAYNLLDYTEEGQSIIHEELQRRSMKLAGTRSRMPSRPKAIARRVPTAVRR